MLSLSCREETFSLRAIKVRQQNVRFRWNWRPNHRMKYRHYEIGKRAEEWSDEAKNESVKWRGMDVHDSTAVAAASNGF